MKSRLTFLIIIIVAIALLSVYWRSKGQFNDAGDERPEPSHVDDRPATSPQSAQVPPSDDTQKGGGVPPERAALIKAIFSQSITIYGRVLDQHGQAIEGARIRFGVHDKPWESGSSYFATSDVDGRFEISGISGAAANTEVSKEGYYNGRESRRILKPGEPTSKKNPAIFTLYKKGEADAVVHRPAAGIEPSEGISTVYFDFNRARFLTSAQGSNLMQVEIKAAPENTLGREWEYSIIIPGGGLQKRGHEFQFIAPDSGYVEKISGGYGLNAPNWRGSFGEEMIALLPDGTVARFEINIGIKGRKYVRIYELVYNPDPTSRNLELDPAKVIKPTP